MCNVSNMYGGKIKLRERVGGRIVNKEGVWEKTAAFQPASAV